MLSDFDRRFSGKTHHFVRVFLCEFGGDREKKGGLLEQTVGNWELGNWERGGRWEGSGNGAGPGASINRTTHRKVLGWLVFLGDQRLKVWEIFLFWEILVS